jgi:hypothetical protein
LERLVCDLRFTPMSVGLALVGVPPGRRLGQ